MVNSTCAQHGKSSQVIIIVILTSMQIKNSVSPESIGVEKGPIRGPPVFYHGESIQLVP